MSVLGNIMGRIFGRAQAATPPDVAAAEAPSPPAAALPAAASPAAMEQPDAAIGAEPPAAAPAMAAVDLVAVMEAKAAAAGQKLNWRTSIVDLMKLLDLDSGLTARKELATELGYTGDMNDTATMNVWLHRQVMAKVAEHGGAVPAELRG